MKKNVLLLCHLLNRNDEKRKIAKFCQFLKKKNGFVKKDRTPSLINFPSDLDFDIFLHFLNFLPKKLKKFQNFVELLKCKITHFSAIAGVP
jgi:hypothetical protein